MPRRDERSDDYPKLRLLLGPDARMGHGKAALLEAIGRTGSISGAAREMRMSYKRAWDLVDEMNRTFAAPLVAKSAGGAQGGGAVLTADGVAVLECYRRMERNAASAVAADLRALARRLR